MLIVELPVIPRVSVLPRRVFQRVVFAWFIHCAGRPGGLEDSQRQICSRFNRSNREIIGNYLKEARELNFLRLLTPSDGLNPDVHIRGSFFKNRTRDSDRFIQLANSLWGSHRGLLSQWPYTEAWGHGCTPPAAVLSLATLNLLDEPIPKKALWIYLQPLVSESSFNESIRWMRSRNLIGESQQGLTISNEWHEQFRAHLNTSRAGYRRQERGDQRRRREGFANRIRVKKSTLTKSDQKKLKQLPCVRKNCKRLGTEIEHFPPRRFLKDLRVQTDKRLVWSICAEHNDETVQFIKRSPSVSFNSSLEIFADARCTELEIYDAVANLAIARFYSGFYMGDTFRAALVVGQTLALFKTVLKSNPLLEETEFRKRAVSKRSHGINAYFPNRSQLD